MGRCRSEAETSEAHMEIKAVSRRIEIAYKAEEADEVAQHAEVRGSASMVNAAVVQWKLVFLSRETCGISVPEAESGGGSNVGVTRAGVSRGPSTVALTGRPERKERGCPCRERSLR